MAEAGGRPLGGVGAGLWGKKAHLCCHVMAVELKPFTPHRLGKENSFGKIMPAKKARDRWEVGVGCHRGAGFQKFLLSLRQLDPITRKVCCKRECPFSNHSLLGKSHT